MKHSLVHSMSAVRQLSTEILVWSAAEFCFQLYSFDATQAYFQILERLMSDLYLTPYEEKGLKRNKLIHLLKQLNRLSESDDYCEEHLTKHFGKALGMKSCISDSIFSSESLVENLVG